MPLRIVAMPEDRLDLKGTALDNTRKGYEAVTDTSNNDPSKWQYIPAFTDINNLWSQVRAICIKHHDCLRELEIGAHGSPDYIDGIFDNIVGGNEDKFAHAMKNNKQILCDEVAIYCSGCNTGHDFGPFDSIAENLRDAIPFDSINFPHRVSFFGTKGYKEQGTSHAAENESVFRKCDGKFSKCKKTGVCHPPYWNGEDATHADAWNRFDNWQ